MMEKKKVYCKLCGKIEQYCNCAGDEEYDE
jgi:hypothetical protein